MAIDFSEVIRIIILMIQFFVSFMSPQPMPMNSPVSPNVSMPNPVQNGVGNFCYPASAPNNGLFVGAEVIVLTELDVYAEPNPDATIINTLAIDTPALVTDVAHCFLNTLDATFYRFWQIEAGEVQGWVLDYTNTLPDTQWLELSAEQTTVPTILDFRVTPSPIDPSGTITLVWETQYAPFVRIEIGTFSWNSFDGRNELSVVAYNIFGDNPLPDELVTRIILTDTQGNTTTQTIRLPISKP
jgi:hypothetical protein